jgi:hypothetical protein
MITELIISMSAFFDTSIRSWSFEAEASFKKGTPGDLWLDMSLSGSAESSKGGSCPDSGWEFGASAALDVGSFSFEAEGEGVYLCDDLAIAEEGFQWAFEFGLDHLELQMGNITLSLSGVNVTAYGLAVGGKAKVMQWWGQFNASVALEAEFKGSDFIASATIESDWRKGENASTISSNLNIEFELNAWEFVKETTSTALLGVASSSADEVTDFHMTLRGTIRGPSSCDVPSQSDIIGAPRTAEVELTLRDLYGVDVNARGSLILYCEAGESPDGQSWTLIIEVGDTDIEIADLTEENVRNGSKSIDRDEMYDLLEEDNITRGTNASFEPLLTYKGNAIDAGALITIDGYKNGTTNKTQLAGSVMARAMGVDVQFQFDARSGGSYSVSASKQWDFDWGTIILSGSFSGGDCDDTTAADEIELKTALIGRIMLKEFQSTSFGFSGKYYCLGGHEGKKWELAATMNEFKLMDEPKRLKLTDVIFSAYEWYAPATNVSTHHIFLQGTLLLGGGSESVLGGASLVASVAYDVRGAGSKNKTLYERVHLNVTGRLDIVAGDAGKVIKASGDLAIRLPCPEDALFAGNVVVMVEMNYEESIADQDDLQTTRVDGSGGGKANGIAVPVVEGTLQFFCPDINARVPEDYFNHQLKGILTKENHGDSATDLDPIALSPTASKEPGLTDFNGLLQMDSPECDTEGVTCAILQPVAQVEFHVDNVPIMDWIVTDVHGHLQIFTGNFTNSTTGLGKRRTIFRGYITASMNMGGVAVDVTVAFDTYGEKTKLYVQVDVMKSWDFDNGMTLYMNAGGSVSVPCSVLGDLEVYGKLRLENIPVGDSVIKFLRSKVVFQSNCGGHLKFYADIDLRNEDGSPPMIEVLDGKYMQLPPGAYIEVEKIPAELSEVGMNEMRFLINVALNDLINVTISYQSYKPPTAAQKLGGSRDKTPSSNIEIGLVVQKCTFNELLTEIGKQIPSAVPEDNGKKFMAQVGAQLGDAIEEHHRKHGRNSDLAQLGMFDVGSWVKDNIGTITLPKTRIQMLLTLNKGKKAWAVSVVMSDVTFFDIPIELAFYVQKGQGRKGWGLYFGFKMEEGGRARRNKRSESAQNAMDVIRKLLGDGIKRLGVVVASKDLMLAQRAAAIEFEGTQFQKFLPFIIEKIRSGPQIYTETDLTLPGAKDGLPAKMAGLFDTMGGGETDPNTMGGQITAGTTPEKKKRLVFVIPISVMPQICFAFDIRVPADSPGIPMGSDATRFTYLSIEGCVVLIPPSITFSIAATIEIDVQKDSSIPLKEANITIVATAGFDIDIGLAKLTLEAFFSTQLATGSQARGGLR